MSEENHGIEELTVFATDVIREAGDKVLSYFGRGMPEIKFDESLITEAELHLRDFFKDQLYRHFPKHQVFKTSRENHGYTHENERYLWIFDPLDGVANFPAGIPIWGISMALLDNFWPTFGVFYMPATGDLFHAQAGGSAYWGDRKVQVSSQEEINDESLLLTFSRFHNHYKTSFPGKIRDFGCTGAHLCYVAMGRAEAALIANESFQDLAAARVIVEAAGGKIFKMDGSEFFLNEYMDGQKIGEPLLVLPSETFPQVRACIQGDY